MRYAEVLGAHLELRSTSKLGVLGGSRPALTCPAYSEHHGVVRLLHPYNPGRARQGTSQIPIITPSCDPGMKRDLSIRKFKVVLSCRLALVRAYECDFLNTCGIMRIFQKGSALDFEDRPRWVHLSNGGSLSAASGSGLEGRHTRSHPI